MPNVMPRKIMLIRHAEKPADDPPPHGVTIHGEHDAKALSVRGWTRAGALVTLFAPTNGQFQNSSLATPQVIYAMGTGSGSESLRPQQTINPLADKLGKQARVNTDFLKGQEKEMIESALAVEGVILICWEHERLAHAARHIPLSEKNQTPVPEEWDAERYDLIWVFDLDADGGYVFQIMPQLLLAGDAPA